MNSIWSDSSDLPSFNALEEDKKTDVLVIGGGMAGLLCAYLLAQANVDYMLVEADTICSGITKNTTAKITSQHGLIYRKLMEEFGREPAQLYLEANEAALKKFFELCGSGIDCDFEEKDAVLYALEDERKIEEELNTLVQLGYPAEFLQELPLPFPTAGAVRFRKQAQFNPLKFAASITQGLHIYEHTPVKEMTPHTAITEKGKITAQKMIVATHFPFLNKHGSYFLKMYQHRSYVIALENAANIKGMYIDASGQGLSFRNYENFLLLGGGAHRTGRKGGGWQGLERFAGEYYPNAKVSYRWSTQDCMTLDAVPYIGQYAKRTPDFYVATGFNKWGMTSSMVAAMILTDLILDKKNPYASTFSPSRTMLRPQLGINALEATVNLLTPSKKRCPHLGCALKWNPLEHSWDCPCHGSRFTEDGKLVDNPATGHLKCYSGHRD